MTDMTNAAPAAAVEPTPSAAGAEGATMPSILSIDEAAQRWMDGDQETETPATVEPKPEEAPAPAAEGEGQEQATAEEAKPAEEEPALDWESVPGDAKFRLRDRTVVTGADLKRRWQDLQQVDHLKQSYEAEVRQFQQRVAQHAQKEQFLAQALPLAIANAQAAIPQEPEPPVYDPSNPVGFLEHQAEYQKAVVYRNRKIDELRQLQWAQAQQAQANQQQQAVQTKAYIAEQQQALFTAIPRLRDKSEREKFHADYVQLAQDLGFSPQEYGQAVDHRVMRMADLAMDGLKYRKLKAEPPKPKPAATQAQTPPVAEPGKRQTAEAAAAAKRQELISRARRTGGSVTDIARLVAELD